MGWRATAGRSVARGIAAAALLLTGMAPVATAAATDSSAVSLPAVIDSSAASPPAVPRTTADWETLSTGLPEQVRAGFLFAFAYNRVDGPAPQVGGSLRRERDQAPLLYVLGGYAFSRERALGSAGFEVVPTRLLKLRSKSTVAAPSARIFAGVSVPEATASTIPGFAGIGAS